MALRVLGTQISKSLQKNVHLSQLDLVGWSPHSCGLACSASAQFIPNLDL